jgi:hypothetical protein
VTITGLSAASGQPYVVLDNAFREDALPYIDKPYLIPFVASDKSVCGQDYIQTAAADAAASNDPFLTFGFQSTRPVTLFVYFDSTVTAPGWLGGAGFADTGKKLSIKTPDRPSPFTVFNLWRKDLGTNGMATLGPVNDANGLMYFVVVSTTAQ